MINHIHAIITDITPTQVIVEVGGIGCQVQITLNTYEVLKDATTYKLFTYLQVTKESYTLYGFADIDEKNWFLQLLSVNSIGPRTAITILSYFKPDQLHQIIINHQVDKLKSIKGLGQKGAQRIILELTGKAANLEVVLSTHYSKTVIYQEALAALVTLGISKNNAEKALMQALKNEKENQDIKVEDLIRLVLKG
jgi:Holliday junction DNA helicase RuvA